MKRQKLSDALADSFYRGKMAERQKMRDGGILLKTKKELGDGPTLSRTVGKLRF